MLKWIGKSVNLACSTETAPFKDNEASRFKANEAKANKAKIKEEKKKEEERKKGGRRQRAGVPRWKTLAAQSDANPGDEKRMEVQDMPMHVIHQSQA